MFVCVSLLCVRCSRAWVLSKEPQNLVLKPLTLTLTLFLDLICLGKHPSAGRKHHLELNTDETDSRQVQRGKNLRTLMTDIECELPTVDVSLMDAQEVPLYDVFHSLCSVMKHVHVGWNSMMRSFARRWCWRTKNTLMIWWVDSFGNDWNAFSFSGVRWWAEHERTQQGTTFGSDSSVGVWLFVRAGCWIRLGGGTWFSSGASPPFKSHSLWFCVVRFLC